MRLSILPRVLIFILPALTLPAAPPTIEEIFRKPAVVDPRLSDDGKLLAYSVFDEKDKEQDDYGVGILNLETGEAQAFMIAGKSTFPAGWLTDTKLVIGSSRQGYSVYDTKKQKATSFNMREMFSIISYPKDRPGLINVWFSEYDTESRSGPALINPATSAARASGQSADRYNVVEWLETPEGERHGFIGDLDGRVLGAIIWKDKVLRYFVRPTEKSPWAMLNLNANEDRFLGFAPDKTKVYISHAMPGDDAPGVYLYDTVKQAFGEKIFGAEGYSMKEAGLQFDERDGALLGVTYLTDVPQYHWFSAPLQRVQETLNAKFPGRVSVIVSRSRANDVFVVMTYADRVPPTYYVYNATKGTMGALPDPFPWLRKAELQPTRSIRWKTRDGVKLQGYLTLPAKRADGTLPPLVVLAHGGPWARDIWGFQQEVQFLATRGYAVFQPNFRGSTGFSNAISEEKAFDFKVMHEDVTDGVHQLAKSGLVDPQRIAIMGGSFGGFLAAAGAAFEPGLYKCAVTIVGVFDWEKIVKQQSRDRYDRFNHEILLQKLGDPKVAKEKFEAISPLHHVDRINIPMYISAGEWDPRVDASQSKQLYAELKKRNVPVEEFIADKEGHGYFETSARMRLYREIAAFLGKYL